MTALRSWVLAAFQVSLASMPEGRINLLLAIPKDLEVKRPPDGVEIMTAPSCRALSFAMTDGEEALWTDLLVKEDRYIESIMKDLKGQGETPTGEVRKTTLCRHGISSAQTIQRIDIILK